MGPFDQPSDLRSASKPRQSGDNVPLLPLQRKSRRGSRNQNIWNEETEDVDFDKETRAALLARNSSDTFREFLEEEEEDTHRLLQANEHDEAPANVVENGSDMDLEEEAKLLEDDSPYEEVRAAVSNTDDPSMACVYIYFCLHSADCLGNISRMGDWQSICNHRRWGQHSILHESTINLNINAYRPTPSIPYR